MPDSTIEQQRRLGKQASGDLLESGSLIDRPAPGMASSAAAPPDDPAKLMEPPDVLSLNFAPKTAARAAEAELEAAKPAETRICFRRQQFVRRPPFSVRCLLGVASSRSLAATRFGS